VCGLPKQDALCIKRPAFDSAPGGLLLLLLLQLLMLQQSKCSFRRIG
jgi:hypothetical protein